jgi:ATP-dependent helicase HrpB
MSELLPVSEIIPELKEKLISSRTVILQAPPGAGKSTRIPLELMDEEWLGGKKILMLEPRRLAARAVANRLAEQIGQSPGERIGYRVRFESRIGKNTQVEILTEGILTRMLQDDNALEGVGLIIFDEFHERSLHADLALALSREVQSILRDDLRILIMSATLDGAALSDHLDNAPVIISEGRQFPVTMKYAEPDHALSIVENTFRTIRRAVNEEEGDVLVFLPGSGEIHRTAELISEWNSSLSVHSLYGDLPFNQQQEALLPDRSGRRKIVLSTSIAETSLTIQGIRIVVDSGYSRVPKFDPRTGFTKLETVKVTLDTADQRAGRAGRLAPGTCYRIWSEKTHHHLISHRKPEILEADLSQLVLEILSWGHENFISLPWITDPPAAHLSQAIELLESLGALENGKITPAGKEMVKIPTHPRLAKLLLYGKQHGITSLASDVAAIIEERDPLRREQGSDLVLRLEVLWKWRKKERVNADSASLERINRVSLQWKKITGNDDKLYSFEKAGELIAAAYPERIARRIDQKGRYRLANGRIARLQEMDPLSNEEWIAIAQLDAGQQEGKIFLAAPFDHSALLEFATEKENISWDEREGLLITKREWKISGLVAKEVQLQNIPAEKIRKVLCDVIRKGGIKIFDWTERAEQFRNRIFSLKKWESLLELPDLRDEYLQSHPEEWIEPYLNEIKKQQDFLKIDLYQVFQSMLSWEMQQKIEKLVPEKIEVPSGSSINLKYSADGSSPILAVRLQELFGMSETPALDNGKIKITLHLLSPAYRPVQITQDLRNFWNNTYHEIRKELKIRYPRHSWPEDPWTAEAVRGAKRKFKN